MRLLSLLPRAAGAALLGAFAGAAWLVLTYAVWPAIEFHTDRDLPAAASGFYPVERNDLETFVWTAPQASITLPGLDRRSSWTCSVTFRGARPDPATLPDVAFAVDGSVVAHRRATNDYRTIDVQAPAVAQKRGLQLSIAVSTPFVPGPADRRQLGVMIRSLRCAPTGGAVALPPARTLRQAAIAAGLFGAGAGLVGVTAGSAVGAAFALASAQSLAMACGVAPFSEFPELAVAFAFWITLALVIGVILVQRLRGQPLRNTARFAAIFAAGALYLKLLVLLHPGKFIGDAMVHAHRLMAVVGGHYLFTSTAPGNYEFPNAIGLYVVAAPFRVLVQDPVVLLRIVTAVADTLAGLLLYAMVVRAWRDRLTAAMAIALATFVPLAFDIHAVGDLTSSFGQSLSVVSVALFTWPALEPTSLVAMTLATIATAGAFLSHTSTFALLFATALLTAAVYWLWTQPVLRRAAAAVLVCLIVATALSLGLYYRHFGSVYRLQYDRIRSEVTHAQPATATAQQPVAGGPGSRPISVRIAAVPGSLNACFGWPILALAAIGLWRLARAGNGDRLTPAVLAWLAACAAFLVLGVLTPIDTRYYPAAIPVVAILAAAGARWGWKRGSAVRLGTAALLVLIVVRATLNWIRWIH